MGNFIADLKVGNIGEEVVYKILENQQNSLEIVDVRDCQYFRDIDVDFIQVVSDGEPRKIEVKTDSLAHRTGNLAYEYFSNYRIGSIGCFEKTKSDYIFYYLKQTKRLYVIDTKLLQGYVSENKERLNLIPMGDNARGYLIKLQKLAEENICWELHSTELSEE